MSANLNKAMFTKLINGSLVQVQYVEPFNCDLAGCYTDFHAYRIGDQITNPKGLP